jgi:sulfite reductase (NADPH) hemoprotein beta-component
MPALRNPQILIASDLRDGEVVFLGAAGWERDVSRALVVHDKEAATEIETFGKAEIAKNHVVDIYLADVAVDADGAPTPLHYRERMRVKGPSVRLDLGKQAACSAKGA